MGIIFAIRVVSHQTNLDAQTQSAIVRNSAYIQATFW